MKLEMKTETVELKVLQYAVDASRREVVDTGMWVLVLIKALCASTWRRVSSRKLLLCLLGLCLIFLNVLVQVFLSALRLNSPHFFSFLRIKEVLYTYETMCKIYIYMCVNVFLLKI